MISFSEEKWLALWGNFAFYHRTCFSCVWQMWTKEWNARHNSRCRVFIPISLCSRTFPQRSFPMQLCLFIFAPHLLHFLKCTFGERTGKAWGGKSVSSQSTGRMHTPKVYLCESSEELKPQIPCTGYRPILIGTFSCIYIIVFLWFPKCLSCSQLGLFLTPRFLCFSG